MWGLTLEEASGPPQEVWPDNEQAVRVFCELGRQWRMGPVGPYALDFNVVYAKMDRMNLSPRAYDELEADIQVLEATALETMHAQRKR